MYASSGVRKDGLWIAVWLVWGDVLASTHMEGLWVYGYNMGLYECPMFCVGLV